ncbi:hypothetical protein BH23THE1_BH23THE1_33290 [soil metagenome]
MATTIAKPEYLPVEFLLSELQDCSLVTWISDQTECLRSAFKIFECEDQDTKEIVHVDGSEIVVVRRDSYEFDIQSDDSINSLRHEDQAKCLHLKDGTVVIFMCQGGGNLVGYHFCFEDAPESTFKEMISNQ